MENFGALFPRIYLDSGFKGWFVSTLLLTAWFGSLMNGPIADRFGRKGSMMAAVVVFLLGSALQSGATSIGMLFGGKSQMSYLGSNFSNIMCRASYCWSGSWYAYHDCAYVYVGSFYSWYSRNAGCATTV